MAEIVELDLVTSLDIPVERILKKAEEAGLTSIIVIGYKENGEEYFKSSLADGGKILWIMERMKLRLLTIYDD